MIPNIICSTLLQMSFLVPSLRARRAVRPSLMCLHVCRGATLLYFTQSQTPSVHIITVMWQTIFHMRRRNRKNIVSFILILHIFWWQTGRHKMMKPMESNVPNYHLLVISSWEQFWYFNAVPKYRTWTLARFQRISQLSSCHNFVLNSGDERYLVFCHLHMHQTLY